MIRNMDRPGFIIPGAHAIHLARSNIVVWLCALMLSLFSTACSNSDAARHKQPVAFNHNIHVEENELECTECHRYVRTGARATIPNIEVCGDCHADEPMTDSEEEQKVIDYVSSGEKIPWVKINRVPPHVYFSHRRHATLGEIECAVCHGNMGKLTSPPERQHVRLKMGWCIKCHEQNHVDNDCVRCHR